MLFVCQTVIDFTSQFSFFRAEIHSFKEVAPNFLNVLTEILWKREMDDNVRSLIYKLAGNVIALNPELVKYYKEIFPKFIEDLTEVSNYSLLLICIFFNNNHCNTNLHKFTLF